MFLMVGPLAKDILVQRALASTEAVALDVAHLITISHSAPESVTIDYAIPFKKEDVAYSLEVFRSERKQVTVCFANEGEECKKESTAISGEHEKFDDFERIEIKKFREGGEDKFYIEQKGI